jgi:hypothetical protein
MSGEEFLRYVASAHNAAVNSAAGAASDAAVALGSAKFAKEQAAKVADAALDAQAAALQAKRAAMPATPDPREAPHFELMQRAELSWASRLNAKRNRWPELQRLDERLAALDQDAMTRRAQLEAVVARRPRRFMRTMLLGGAAVSARAGGRPPLGSGEAPSRCEESAAHRPCVRSLRDDVEHCATVATLGQAAAVQVCRRRRFRTAKRVGRTGGPAGTANARRSRPRSTRIRANGASRRRSSCDRTARRRSQPWFDWRHENNGRCWECYTKIR